MEIVKRKIQRLAKRIFKKYLSLLPVKQGQVFFESYMGTSYACSPKAIYQRMSQLDRFSSMNFVWAFKQPDSYQRREGPGKGARLVKYRSCRYYIALARSRYWVVNGWIPTGVVAKKSDQVMVQCWHGTPLKRLRNDIIPNTRHATLSYKKQVEANLKDTSRYDYFISPSEFASDRFSSAFDLVKLGKRDILIETGYPRNDFLFTHSVKDKDRVRRELKIPKDKKIILYAPTWRDDQHQKVSGFTYSIEVDFDSLRQSIGDDYVILFRAHYNIASQFDFHKYRNFVYDVSSVDDVNDLYIISDLLVTDYSSVLFDFANLKKPMIFYMYDLDFYEHELRGFYIDLNELPGPIVKTELDLISAVKSIDTSWPKFQDKYQLFNQKYNYLDDANASQRVIDRVFGVVDSD